MRIALVSSQSQSLIMANLKTGIISQKLEILNAIPNEVYKAILYSREHSQFSGSKAKSTDRVGANFRPGMVTLREKTSN
jgi:hypothetical protein